MTMTDAIAPRQDLAALAVDVDRLFRARQDGRQMPMGERFESAAGWRWKPAWEETATFIELTRVDPNPTFSRCGIVEMYDSLSVARSGGGWTVNPSAKAEFRTLRHVAMLALTEPAFFQQCLAEVVRHDPAVARAWDVWEWPDGTETRKRHARGGVLNYDVSPARIAADVASTHRHLVDLDRRLRDWREARRRALVIATVDAHAASAGPQGRGRGGGPRGRDGGGGARRRPGLLRGGGVTKKDPPRPRPLMDLAIAEIVRRGLIRDGRSPEPRPTLH